MHGNDYLWIQALRDLGGSSRVDGVESASGHEENVDSSYLAYLGIVESQPQVSRVRKLDPAQLEDPDGVLSPLAAPGVVVEGAHALELYPLGLLLSGALDHLRVSFDRRDAVVVEVVMRDHAYVCALIRRRIPHRAVERIGHDLRLIVQCDEKRAVPQPLYGYFTFVCHLRLLSAFVRCFSFLFNTPTWEKTIP